MPFEPPPVDDRAIWDLWLSQYRLPVVLVADELGLFSRLHERPADLLALVADLRLPARSVEAMLAVLAASDFLVKRLGVFHLTDVARTYLLPDSEFYWLAMLRQTGTGQAAADLLMERLRTDNLGPDTAISRRWERGEMTPEDARSSNRRMHSHSLPAAVGLARNGNFEGVRRLLDVAGGSGCFSIALALRYGSLRCTVADLPPVAADTRTYIARYGCEDRVDTYPFNMFSDPWPSGYDAIFFSNVLHDWDANRRAGLAARTFAALPPGGRIYLHEMLLNDTSDGPLPPALFSVMMLGTRGKQFSAPELNALLTTAGFAHMTVTPSYAYYSLVTATKPA
ncbi:MAG TPA: methyltransferase [Chloroflexota bacterium]|nr:methyltransferase [Chloroflexota bacterium]